MVFYLAFISVMLSNQATLIAETSTNLKGGSKAPPNYISTLQDEAIYDTLLTWAIVFLIPVCYFIDKKVEAKVGSNSNNYTEM